MAEEPKASDTKGANRCRFRQRSPRGTKCEKLITVSPGRRSTFPFSCSLIRRNAVCIASGIPASSRQRGSTSSVKGGPSSDSQPPRNVTSQQQDVSVMDAA
eukprot:Polyplicarium_translucidae@DN2458_c0_g1_i3.p1